ncbi:Fic family protein [Lichenicoccus roseus]|uniref:Fic family protein n=1 Tax=Lichenicoccus roseus TaxID=2683649 RepID=A0A5R9J4M4_9PROT|nr:Fic family protein [Lichenicoccus roseus]
MPLQQRPAQTSRITLEDRLREDRAAERLALDARATEAARVPGFDEHGTESPNEALRVDLPFDDRRLDDRRFMRTAGVADNMVTLLPGPLPRVLPTGSWLPELEQAAWALGQLKSKADTLPSALRLHQLHARRDAIAASQLVGTSATLAMLLAREADQSPSPSRDLRQAENHVAYYFSLLQSRDTQGRSLEPTIETLCGMHRRLNERITAHAGMLRSKPITLGGYRLGPWRVVPPPPQEIAGALQDLESFLTGAKSLPMLVRAALACAQVEAIAPFDDGNDFITFLLPSVISLHAGYPPLFLSDIFLANRVRFRECLSSALLGGDWDAWLTFFLQAVVESCAAAERRIGHLTQTAAAWHARLAQVRSDSQAHRLAELVLDQPVVTVGQAQRMLGVSFQTANTAVQTLVRHEILAQYQRHDRNRIFLAPRIVAMFEAAEA